MTTPQPETILSWCCRQKLARDLDLAPSELAYIGVQEMLSCRLYCFNVMREGVGFGSTRAIRVEL